MKTFIHKINQYLLERFPTIWNTRLVWMLLAALLLHAVFFVFGVFTLSNPEMLHERYVSMIFFENGSVFLSSIISVLLIVGWLIYMFKNNAFKNFYPTTKTKLFGQFMCYLLIVFSCTTFYLSYSYGIKAFIASTYPVDMVNKQIEVANDAALFFSESISDYTIDKRRYPERFDELYCETQEIFIDKDQAHIMFLDKAFQYYTLSTKSVPLSEDNYPYGSTENPKDSILKGYLYSKVKDSLRIYYYKDSVVDVTPLIKTKNPSYYNASSTFYISIYDTLNTNYNSYDYNYDYYPADTEYDYGYSPKFNLRHKLRNKRNNALLNRNSKNEIKGLLKDFLEFSEQYQIDHNITADQWLDLVYHPEAFEVKHFIRTEPKHKFDYTSTAVERTPYEQYYVDHVSDFHYDHHTLRIVFENLEDINNSNPLFESIHFFIWFSFLFTCLVFMFRVTGLKPLLFSIITVGLLTLLVTLFAALTFYLIQDHYNNADYFICYLILGIGTIILLIPLVFIERVKKIIVAICMNISLIGFPLYMLLILGIITMHQNDACREDLDYYEGYYQCDTVLSYLDFNWSYVLFFAGIIFIFLYTKVIKHWKSLPEG